MKKILILLLIVPFFFACKDDTSSSSEPESKPDPKPIVQGSCGDGELNENEVCDGDYGCKLDCTGYRRAQLAEACTDTVLCDYGLDCVSGKCERQKKAIDETCASNEECISGNCSEGKCSSN